MSLAGKNQANVLVNNAGITLFKPFMEQDEETWDRVMTIQHYPRHVASVCRRTLAAHC